LRVVWGRVAVVGAVRFPEWCVPGCGSVAFTSGVGRLAVALAVRGPWRLLLAPVPVDCGLLSVWHGLSAPMRPRRPGFCRRFGRPASGAAWLLVRLAVCFPPAWAAVARLLCAGGARFRCAGRLPPLLFRGSGRSARGPAGRPAARLGSGALALGSSPSLPLLPQGWPGTWPGAGPWPPRAGRPALAAQTIPCRLSSAWSCLGRFPPFPRALRPAGFLPVCTRAALGRLAGLPVWLPADARFPCSARCLAFPLRAGRGCSATPWRCCRVPLPGDPLPAPGPRGAGRRRRLSRARLLAGASRGPFARCWCCLSSHSASSAGSALAGPRAPLPAPRRAASARGQRSGPSFPGFWPLARGHARLVPR